MNLEENKNFIETCSKNIKDILDFSIKYKIDNAKEKCLVIYDLQTKLSNILFEGYKNNLSDATYIDFDKSNKEEIMNEIEKLQEKDLVIMIQSTNFRLDDFRIRLHLFSKKLKVIEHMHLDRNKEEVYDVYINSLEYDKDYLHTHGNTIKNKIDNAKNLTIKSYEKDMSGDILKENKLMVNGELENAMLNIGDYTEMQNVGGTFPIGEVFTESKIIEDMNGEVSIYALADNDFVIQMYEPFTIKIENGIVTGHSDNAPQQFVKVWNEVKNFERPMIREIGFGINKAITKDRYLGDITAFERIYGMHLSLGEKHSMYKKSTLTTKKTKYHVDLFPVVDIASTVNKNTDLEEIIFEDGKYVLS